MPIEEQYRAPVPIFVPTLSIALVLVVLFVFGLKEQQRLADDRIEQVVSQRESIASLVAREMGQELAKTERSVVRYAHELQRQLDRPVAAASIQQPFDETFERAADGAIRSRRDVFNPQSESGVWIPAYAPLDDRTKEFFVQAKYVTDLYGLGVQDQPFVDTWVLPASSGIVIFWPGQPDFIFEAGADMDYRDSIWVSLTRPAENPERQARWTPLAFDPTPKVWMMSAVAPIYWHNEWYGAAGHDLPLDSLLARTQLLRQEQGSYFALVTGQDLLVASARYADKIKESNGTLTLQQIPDRTLERAVFEARSVQPGQAQLRLTLDNNVVFVNHIGDQDWLLLNVIPLGPIASNIATTFDKLRNIAIIALVVELIIATLILYWSHHRSRRQFDRLMQVQGQLQVNEKQYRTLIDNIPGIVYRCRNDAQWTMLYLSPATQDFTGYPASDFVENNVRSFHSIIYPDDREVVNNIVLSNLSRHKPFIQEYRIVKADGSIRWVLEHGRYLADGTDNELEGVILDITAQKEAEEKLRELNNTLEYQVEARTVELRTAIRDLETFNYAVSHDLRAPVRQVSAYLEAIGEELQDSATPDIKHMIARSELALNRMKEMISGLQAFSQLGKNELTPVSINVNDMVRNVIDKLPAAIRERVTFELPPLDNVVADRVLLRVVLQNLIDNAVKFSANTRNPVIQLLDHSTPKEWILAIHDNGVGFNPQYAKNLFMLFQRLHTQEAFPGFGIGLALCNKIITLHSGRIWAESEPNQGARFYVAIPVRQRIRQPRFTSASL